MTQLGTSKLGVGQLGTAGDLFGHEATIEATFDVASVQIDARFAPDQPPFDGRLIDSETTFTDGEFDRDE